MSDMDVSLQIGEDKILDALIIMILLGLSKTAYVLAKENFIRIYNEMEL